MYQELPGQWYRSAAGRVYMEELPGKAVQLLEWFYV